MLRPDFWNVCGLVKAPSLLNPFLTVPPPLICRILSSRARISSRLRFLSRRSSSSLRFRSSSVSRG